MAHRPPRRLIEVIPENLFREPLDFVFADHYRQQMVCDLLKHLADTAQHSGDIDREITKNLLDYFDNDLPLHLADEEESLFPIMRQHYDKDREIVEMIGILTAEHGKDEVLAVGLMQQLTSLYRAGVAEDVAWFQQLVATFIETQERHLAWENGLLLPLARRALNSAELRQLGKEMAARRGIPYPE